MFIAEGPKLVTELLAGNFFVCTYIYALADWVAELPPVLNNCYTNKIEIVKDFELQKISALTQANQVLAVFEKKAPINNIQSSNKISLVLDDIQDPGNLGTIIRIADWFGIENIICSLLTADMYNSKVVQSTMASLGRVNIIYTDIAEWLSANKHIKKYAATLDGTALSGIGKINEGILIVGNESKGISEEIMKLADEKITIPKTGEAESLNAAVATGIILYTMVGPGSYA